MAVEEINLDQASKKDSMQLQSWWHFVKTRNIILGVIVSGIGLGTYFVPIPYGLKDLLSGAVIGAGVAAILSEFTFAFERSESEQHQQILNLQNENLLHRIGSMKNYSAKSEWRPLSRLFRLGTSLALIQWQKGDDKKGLLYLAQVLELRDIIEHYVNQPDLQSLQAVAALSTIREEVELRYPREGVNAFVTGFTLITWIIMDGPEDGTFEIVRNGLMALELKVEVKQYLERSLLIYKERKCQLKNIIYFANLLGLCISNFTTGSEPTLTFFFEKDQPPIDEDPTVQRMEAILQKVAGRIGCFTAKKDLGCDAYSK